MGLIAVIDTETNWFNELMSVGVVIADSFTYEIKDQRYYVITPAYLKDGMYSDALFIKEAKLDGILSRHDAMCNIRRFLYDNNVDTILAYNANFDYNVLNELQSFIWRDIMAIAAYKQHNEKIPFEAECFKTGRLKRNYGVETMYRLLSGDCSYHEKHNGLCDAMDELALMRFLNKETEEYKQIKK